MMHCKIMNAIPHPFKSGAAATGADATSTGLASTDARLVKGHEARERLMAAALRLFADKGYGRTSTREVCQQAGVNVAAIHYYFGDKAALYREVFLAPVRTVLGRAMAGVGPQTGFKDAMLCTYQAFLEPQRTADESMMQVLRLHFRERIDPTGLVAAELAALVRPHFEAVVAAILRDLSLPAPDDEVHGLAMAVLALGADAAMSCEWNRTLAPGLFEGGDGVDRTIARLTRFAVALLDTERARRSAVAEAAQ